MQTSVKNISSAELFEHDRKEIRFTTFLSFSIFELVSYGSSSSRDKARTAFRDTYCMSFGHHLVFVQRNHACNTTHQLLARIIQIETVRLFIVLD